MWQATELDPRDGPVSEQVAALVVRHVERGALSAGSSLPSERDLARRLGVSRVTIVRALAALRARGVVATRHGSGSVIAPTDRLLDPVAPTAPRGGNTHHLDLRFGTTAAPHEVEEAAARVAGGGLRAAMATDGPPAGGSPGLRAALAERLTGEGVPTLPTQLTLTSGAAAGLDLVLQALAVGPGVALTESPTYPTAIACLRRHRLEVVGWPAGATGWDLDQLAHLVRRTRAKVIYVQPDNHNPTGLSIPAARRPELGELLRRTGVTLIVDETLRPLWFEDSPQPPPVGRQPGVISISSLSKTVWGGLRVGWVRASQDVTRRLHRLPSAAFLAPSAFDELLAAEILDELAAIVGRRRRILHANLGTLAEAIAAGDDVTWDPPSGGMTAWLELASDDASAVATEAGRRGLLVTPGALFTPDSSDRRHLRVPFTPSPGQLVSAMALLREAMVASRVGAGTS